jgi:hypothetical protein
LSSGRSQAATSGSSRIDRYLIIAMSYCAMHGACALAHLYNTKNALPVCFGRGGADTVLPSKPPNHPRDLETRDKRSFNVIIRMIDKPTVILHSTHQSTKPANFDRREKRIEGSQHSKVFVKCLFTQAWNFLAAREMTRDYRSYRRDLRCSTRACWT